MWFATCAPDDAACDYFNRGLYGKSGLPSYFQDALSVGKNLTASIGIRHDKEESPPPPDHLPAPQPPPSPSLGGPNAQFPVLMDPRIFRLGSKVEW